MRSCLSLGSSREPGPGIRFSRRRVMNRPEGSLSARQTYPRHGEIASPGDAATLTRGSLRAGERGREARSDASSERPIPWIGFVAGREKPDSGNRARGGRCVATCRSRARTANEEVHRRSAVASHVPRSICSSPSIGRRNARRELSRSSVPSVCFLPSRERRSHSS